MNEIIKLLHKEKAKRVLDLGSGTGRHTILLAKCGFDAYGMDTSKEGLKLTRKWLKSLGLAPSLKRASCYKKFPYPDGFFDAVISVQVIHHNYHEKILYCISEIERVLKPGGNVFIVVPEKMKNEFHPNVKIILPRTYIPTDGIEKGVVHFHYSKSLLRKDFKNFDVSHLHTDKRQHFCLLGKLK